MSSNPPASFTHVEVHSHYTLLGSTSPVADLVARAAAQGMSHLALTDTNALYGTVAFERACRADGVQAIAGMALTAAREPDLPPIGSERLERDLVGVLEYAWVDESLDSPRRLVSEAVIRRNASFVALVDSDRRFVGLVDRYALLSQMSIAGNSMGGSDKGAS